MINLLRVTQKSKVYSTFLKYPEVIFTPATVGLTCKISLSPSRRICVQLCKDGRIIKVKRGFYKLQTQEIIC